MFVDSKVYQIQR